LNVAAGIGFSATALSYGNQEGLVSALGDPNNEVSYVKKIKVLRDEQGNPVGQEPIYGTIQREKWVDDQSELQAKQQISKRLQALGLDDDQIVISTRESSESPIGTEIVVTYTQKEDPDGNLGTPDVPISNLKRKLPDHTSARIGRGRWEEQRQNIPVVVEERTVSVTSTDDQKLSSTSTTTSSSCGEFRPSTYKNNWEQIPGGCAMTGYKDADPVGSACCTFNHPSSNDYYLVTAGHVVRAPSANNTDWGNPDKASSDGYTYAKILKQDRDYALVKAYQGNINNRLRNPNSMTTDYDFYGIITDDMIQSEYARGTETCMFQGHMSGRMESDVDEVVPNSTANNDQQIRMMKNVSDGDSGGIIYDPSGGGVFVMGLINKFWCGKGDGGNTGQALENTFSGYIA
jgi:hypothetical protein